MDSATREYVCRRAGNRREYCLLPQEASPLLTFTDQAAETFDQLRRQHSRKGRMDLRSAAIALAHQATLVTRNGADFHGIDGLAVEDWSQES